MQAEVEVETPESSESRFNPSRIPTTERSKALVEAVRNQLLSYESHLHPRDRQRRAVDQARFDRIVSAIVCELAHAAQRDPTSWRYISLSKRMTPEQATGASFMTAERIRSFGGWRRQKWTG
jgi:putative hemolysin